MTSPVESRGRHKKKRFRPRFLLTFLNFWEARFNFLFKILNNHHIILLCTFCYVCPNKKDKFWECASPDLVRTGQQTGQPFVCFQINSATRDCAGSPYLMGAGETRLWSHAHLWARNLQSDLNSQIPGPITGFAQLQSLIVQWYHLLFGFILTVLNYLLFILWVHSLHLLVWFIKLMMASIKVV